MYEISVIIPFYKSEKYILDCLKSIIHSSVFKKCEVILINDGSPDSSAEIIRNVVDEYDNIRMYTYENHGLSAARNRGMEKAAGKYIFFIDSDDFVKRNYLSQLFLKAEKTQSDIVFAGFSEVRENGEMIRTVDRAVLRKTGVMTGRDFLNLRMDQGDWLNQVWCALYRRDFLEKNHLFFDTQIRLYEDILFTSQILICAERVSVIPEYGYMYRFHQNSMVHDGIKERDIVAAIQVLEKLIRFYRELDEKGKKTIGRVLFEQISMILYYIGCVDPENRKKYYSRFRRPELFRILRHSAATPKEGMKYLIFRYCMNLYYSLVKRGKG